MAANSLKELQQRAEQGLMEIAGLISKREYNLSMVRSRQFMERLIRDYAEEASIEYTDLADAIEQLYQSGRINRNQRDAFHTIRITGNKAVHEGNSDPQDAQNAYYLLKEQLEAYLNAKARPQQKADRTPVAVQRPQSGGTGNGGRRTFREENSQEDGREETEVRSRRARTDVPSREDRLKARNSQGSRGHRNPGGIELYDILRILIPVICIILLICILRSCFGGKSTKDPTTAPATTVSKEVQQTTAAGGSKETTKAAEPESTAAATEAARARYRVKGSSVNVRYYENQSRIYTQLTNGTEIGEVEEISGSDFVRFRYDGKDVVISKNYIERIE